MKSEVNIPNEKIEAFCRRWLVRELAFFGSILRDDFTPSSDVDVLVSFEENVGWSMWDLIDMKSELELVFGRKVDLVEKEAIRNPWRRKEIISSREVIYAA